MTEQIKPWQGEWVSYSDHLAELERLRSHVHTDNTETLRNALAENDRLRAENEALRKDAKECCVLGLAAIATYGRRDDKGLTGLSKDHWRTLVEVEKRIDAAIAVSYCSVCLTIPCKCRTAVNPDLPNRFINDGINSMADVHARELAARDRTIAELREEIRHFEHTRDVTAIALRQRAEAAEAKVPKWLPIESAPKDATLFLAGWVDGRMCVMRGNILAEQKERETKGIQTPEHLQFQCTHWMPLPAPPSEGAKS